MNVVILGAGEIGLHMARLLCERGCNVSVVEKDEQAAAAAAELLDARVVEGTGASVSTLEEAGIAECDTFFALTSSDTANLVAASLAKALGARKAIVRVHADVQQEQWLFDFRARFDADHLFSPARLAAIELAKFIRNPECLLVEEIARGRIELQQTRVPPTSPAAGRSLREIQLPQRVRVGLIQRGEITIVPGGEEK
ncbi:MAG: NAD-binding protein, partial [Terrimicrobiaceae bacterium]|nr:NAD-binding protein [Terrimicrobiaceae bacterium]